jgi:hypothetical protein
MCVVAEKPRIASARTVAAALPPREGDRARAGSDSASSDSDNESRAATQLIKDKGSSGGEDSGKVAEDGEQGQDSEMVAEDGEQGEVREKGAGEEVSAGDEAGGRSDKAVERVDEGEEEDDDRGETRKRKRTEESGSGGQAKGEGRGLRQKKNAEILPGKEITESAPMIVTTPKARGGFRVREKSAASRREKSATSKPTRYKKVEGNKLRMMLEAPPSVISDVRLRFQLLVFMRDGILINRAATARNVNIGLLLDAAYQIIQDDERYNKFFGAVTDAMDAGDK